MSGKKILFILLLIVNIVQAQNNPPSANDVLKAAFDVAKSEKKNVFVIFHASWCGWCRKMDAAMTDPACKKYFDENYVIRHLTVLESDKNKHLENPGAKALYDQHAPSGSGIPFWLIFNPDGKLIASAKMPDGKNSGCPATQPEVEHFIAVLKQSSALDAEALKIIYDRFRENER